MLNKKNIGQLPSISDEKFKNDLSTQNIARKRSVSFIIFTMTWHHPKEGTTRGTNKWGPAPNSLTNSDLLGVTQMEHGTISDSYTSARRGLNRALD